MQKTLILMIFLFLQLNSCSRTSTLNLKDHQFGNKGKTLIWLQIAGLSEEHLAMLKFGSANSESVRPFEENLCLGKLWSYNFRDLRPRPDFGFMSQLTGAKSINGSCSDLKKPAIWTYLKKVNFSAGILEGMHGDAFSLENYLKCPVSKEYFKGLTVWRMSKTRKGLKQFHSQEKIPTKPGFYFDKSCESKECYVSEYSNVQAIWKKLSENTGPKLFILRNFSFYRALKSKDLIKARRILNEISKTVDFLKQNTDKLDTTFLLTTSGAILFEFPTQGKQWANFQKTGKSIIFRKQSLLSSAWSNGPASENFCGLYNESDILKRILWKAESKSFGL